MYGSNLSAENKAQLRRIISLCNEFYELPKKSTGLPVEEYNLIQLKKKLIYKKIAMEREVICAAYVTQETMQQSGIKHYTEEEMNEVKSVDQIAMQIMEPVYDRLSKQMLKDAIKWISKVSGLNPYMYQKQTVYQVIRMMVYRSRPDIIYTLLISRGGGKTFSLSWLAAFTLLYWDRYIYHVKNMDYGIAVSTAVDKQLAEFKKNIRGHIETFFKMFGDSVDLSISAKNAEEIIIYKDGKPYSKCIFRIASPSMESVHVDLLLGDEAKFYSRQNLFKSVLPCVGGRTGIKVLISSADEYYCEFQRLVESNIKEYKKDNIIRHIEFHWENMIQYNPSYQITVMSQLKAVGGNRNDPTFATQYDNKFLSSGGSDFFDISTMLKCGYIKKWNPQPLMHSSKYVCIAGWDIGVTGDNSILTFKLAPNGQGESRDLILIASIVMNISKLEIRDIVAKQIPRIIETMIYFNCKAIMVDTSGLGNGADILLKEGIIKKIHEFRDGFDISNVIGVKYSESSKVEMFNNYMNRLKAGLEILPHIQDIERLITDDNYCEVLYKQMYNVGGFDDLLPQMVRFYIEHKFFSKKIEYNEKTGASKIRYVQAPLAWLHDDTLNSSALCSQVLRERPYITNFDFDDYSSGNDMSGRYTTNR